MMKVGLKYELQLRSGGIFKFMVQEVQSCLYGAPRTLAYEELKVRTVHRDWHWKGDVRVNVVFVSPNQRREDSQNLSMA
jgi:hypothetical protein